jgi:hypothetical protein
MCQTTRAVLDDDEHVQHAESGRYYDEEVARKNRRRVTLQER